MPPEELKKLVLKGSHDMHYHDAAFTMHQDKPYFSHLKDTMLAASVHLHFCR
ncbi:hypothetical protein SAMN05518847_105321 [Paenibacillus sp. OV219]|nr:hypothetical protein SAMN05518847_105321 [Paenibacillus sp. OV219]